MARVFVFRLHAAQSTCWPTPYDEPAMAVTLITFAPSMAVKPVWLAPPQAPYNDVRMAAGVALVATKPISFGRGAAINPMGVRMIKLRTRSETKVGQEATHCHSGFDRPRVDVLMCRAPPRCSPRRASSPAPPGGETG